MNTKSSEASKNVIAIKLYIAIMEVYFTAYIYAMTDKLAVIQMVLQTENETILGKVSALLVKDSGTQVKSQIPEWHWKEIRKRDKAYESGKSKAYSWEETKKILKQKKLTGAFA